VKPEQGLKDREIAIRQFEVMTRGCEFPQGVPFANFGGSLIC
jgi:hypothetical protein